MNKNIKKNYGIIKDLTVLVESLTGLVKACSGLLIAFLELIGIIFFILSIKP